MAKTIFDLIEDQSITADAEVILQSLDKAAPPEYRELAVVLTKLCRQRNRRVIGLGGGQGAGKSTLANLLKQAIRLSGESSQLLSIDDFYLSQRERKELASKLHELFQTRGPPGTHDVGWLLRTIDSLLLQQSAEVPSFDKGTDERIKTRVLSPPCDRVVLEGWCVGALPQSPAVLRTPVNELERSQDATGAWRQTINERLRTDYAEVWSRVDLFVFLQVPNLQSVRRWRLQQENDRPADQRKDQPWVNQFVQHYQRITEWMLEEAPNRADVVVQLNDEHRVVDVVVR